jgi:hypothetical protein
MTVKRLASQLSGETAGPMRHVGFAMKPELLARIDALMTAVAARYVA